MEMSNSFRMRIPLLVLVVLVSLFMTAAEIPGQSSAEDRADKLRAQLVEVRSSQERLGARLKELEEELKPETIEKTFAGIGSTRPEDLREVRRRQLESEKLSIQNQLKQLDETQMRVETAIVQADAVTYNQSANVVAMGSQTAPAKASTNQRRTRRNRAKPRTRRVQ
jgi:chaperonin cofactor prefoldin